MKEEQKEEKKGESASKKPDFVKAIRNIGIDKLLIIAACGVILIILSFPTDEKKTSTTTNDSAGDNHVQMSLELSNDEYCEQLEKRLEELLSKIDGISDVKVMITLKCTSESVVLSEVSYEKSDKKSTGNAGAVSEENSYKNNSTVVYEKDAKGNEIPYVVKENVPQIEGIAVVAKGGDDAKNILKITNVLQALFNIDAHKISVIGMRNR